MRRPLSAVPGLETLVSLVRSSFRRKLAAALLVLFLIVSLGAVGLYVQVGGLLEENVEQSMTAAADTEASELSEWRSRNRLVVRLLSEHPVYETGNSATVRAFLRTQRTERPDAAIVRAYVVDRRNQTVATSTDAELEGRTVEELGWSERFAFRDFDAVQVTRPYRVRNGTAVLGFISPIRSLPECLLVVEIDTASVFDRFEHPVDGGFTRVVNSNGTVVFSDDANATLTQYQDGPGRAQAVSSGLRGNPGFTDSPAYGGRQSTTGGYVAAYAPVPDSEWVVIEHAAANDAYVIAQQGLHWIGGIAVFTLIALVGVVGVLGRDVAGALARLTERAKRIESGQYDVEFDTDRPDEFGDLNRAMASTQEALQQRIEEIRRTKAALERSNTTLEERSEMVDVLNRILRHNVRNEVNVITGRAELAASRVDDDDAVQEDLAAVRDAAWELGTISTRTQRIKQLLAEAETAPEPLRLEAALAPKLAEVEADTPSASVDLDGDSTGVVAEAAQTFPTAIADVVEQIAMHNDGQVHVNVTVTTTETDSGEETVVLRIDDDGDGLPPLDVEAVKSGEETPLNHAEGLALWCLEWTVTKSDGELLVSPSDATLEVRVPPASTAT